MAECEKLGACPFFNDKMAEMPSTAAVYKRSYCQGDSSKCARYSVSKALGGPKVPVDLYPNEEQRARKIIVEGYMKWSLLRDSL